MRHLPRPPRLLRSGFVGRRLAARDTIALTPCSSKHKRARRCCACAAASMVVGACTARAGAARVLRRPLVSLECKWCWHGGRLGIHLRHAQLAAVVPQDALAAGESGGTQEPWDASGKAPTSASLHPRLTATLWHVRQHAVARWCTAGDPWHAPGPPYLTGRALNLGMAAISSASTTSRGLNRGGRARFLVAN